MTQTNAKNCLLAGRCKLAGDSAQCTAHCEAFIRIKGRASLAGLPADYRLVTLDNSPARAEQAAIYATLAQYVKTFERQFREDGAKGSRIKSFYLYSESPGTGKTTTAAALLNAWLMEHFIGAVKRGLQPEQQPAYFLDVNDWQSLYNEFNRKNIPQDVGERASREYYRREQAARKAPFAVLDDVGVREATPPFRADLHGIINYRTANSLPTIFTSNVPLEYLENVFDSRLYDRVRDQCGVMTFQGNSRRGRRM